MPIVRKIFVIENGVEKEVNSADIREIIAKMTPEEKKAWQDKYRFTPITNKTGNNYYSGTMRDLGIA